MRRDCVSPRSKCPIIGRLNGTTVSNLDGTTTSIYVASNDRFHDTTSEWEREREKRNRFDGWDGVNAARMILSSSPLPPVCKESARRKEKEAVTPEA